MNDKSIADILKLEEVNTDSVRSQIKSGHDAIAFLCHLMMIQHGFRCVGLSEAQESREHDQQYQLPDGWNSSSDVYSFKYKHKQSSMTYILKCVTLGNKLLINGLTVEDGKYHSLELNISDYFKSTEQSSLTDMYKDLNKIDQSFKENISNKMVPFQHKEGYESSVPAETQSAPTTASQNRPSQPRQQPPQQPSRPRDDYDPLRIGPIRGPGIGGMMPGVGASDLYPSFGGFPGTRPPGFGGGGMMVGPNHPGFGGGGGMMMGPPRFGGRGLPPGVPQGARFDPYGPFGPGAPGRGNPNPDEFRPPQFNEDDTGSDNPYWF